LVKTKKKVLIEIFSTTYLLVDLVTALAMSWSCLGLGLRHGRSRVCIRLIGHAIAKGHVLG
jgi:hypothetical protein